MFTETEGYLGAKSKGFDAAMKRAVKEHLLGVNNVLKQRESAKNSSKGTSLFCN